MIALRPVKWSWSTWVKYTHPANPTMYQKYPTMRHFEQKCPHLCTFPLQNNALWDMEPVSCGIYGTLRFIGRYPTELNHYDDAILGVIASLITSLTIVYSTVYSDADQRKHQSSASLAFVWGIHRWPVNSPHKWPVTRKMFPFDDVIMRRQCLNHVHIWWDIMYMI